MDGAAINHDGQFEEDPRRLVPVSARAADLP